MDYRIQLFRGPERRYIGTIPLLTVVRDALERLYGWNLDDARIRITVTNVPQDSTPTGSPLVEHLVPDFGYTYITVTRQGRVVYQHPHPLDDILTWRLQELLREAIPEEEHWGFRLDIPGMPPASRSRPSPHVEGVAVVRPFEPGERPAFGIQRLAEPPLPEMPVAAFGVDPAAFDASAGVVTLVPEAVENEIMEARDFSRDVEEGGFLAGHVFRAAGQDDLHIVEITGVLPAHYTGASFLHFTFTGDSFVHVKQTLATRQRGERLVGWYHTHLFPATDEMGLSSVDVTLHFGTYTIPWQVAGLINLDGADRTLRFYVRSGKGMVRCPMFVIPEASHEPTSGPRSGQ